MYEEKEIQLDVKGRAHTALINWLNSRLQVQRLNRS